MNAAAPPPNQLPTANAGTNQTITLPVNTVTLTGIGNDPDGTIVSYQWSKIDGPAQFVVLSPLYNQTVVNNLLQGVYQFELRVTDDQGGIGRDTVSVTVNAAAPPPNQLPTANAGTNQTITLPVNTVTLTGIGNDPDGTIVSYQWTKISGPTTYSIATATASTTVVNNLLQGVYQFELRVTDNQGGIGRDTVSVTVNAAAPPPNQLPTANAGTNQTITLPVNSITVSGTGTDSDGTITAYQWSMISGPSTPAIETPNNAQSVIRNLTEGVYIFVLNVIDNDGAQATDLVKISVEPDIRISSSAKIYPNPVTANLNVVIDAITNVNKSKIQIFNMSGILVYEQEFIRTQQLVIVPISVSHFPNGSYVIKIGLDINKTRTLLFIKQ